MKPLLINVCRVQLHEPAHTPKTLLEMNPTEIKLNETVIVQNYLITVFCLLLSYCNKNIFVSSQPLSETTLHVLVNPDTQTCHYRYNHFRKQVLNKTV